MHLHGSEDLIKDVDKLKHHEDILQRSGEAAHTNAHTIKKRSRAEVGDRRSLDNSTWDSHAYGHSANSP